MTAQAQKAVESETKKLTLVQAVQDAVTTETGHCTACFSGAYPINLPPWLFSEDRDKMLFEQTLG